MLECHHLIIGSRPFQAGLIINAPKIECGHRSVFARFAYDDS